MESAGISSIVLKGPSIARWLYPSGGRTYVDTDLLVPGADFGRAADVLMGLGFRAKLEGFHPFEVGDSLATESPMTRLLSAGHGPPGTVDLHHNLSALAVDDEALWAALEADTETLTVAGVTTTVLGRTALAFHIVVHAVQHDFHSHTGEDLRRVVAALPSDDWGPVALLAGRLRAQDLLGFGLRRSPAGAEIADGLGLPDLPPGDWRFSVASAPRGSMSLQAFRSAKGVRTKLRWIRWTLLPSPAKIRLLAGLQPGTGGWPLLMAYARRWLALGPATFRAERFLRRRQSVEPDKALAAKPSDQPAGS
jgi:hypothetical protein